MPARRDARVHVRSRSGKRTAASVLHNFTLVLRGVQQLDTELEDAVFEAGCDDAVLGMRSGVAFLEFDRQAATLPEAVLSAIAQVETVEGVDVVRVEPDDLVTASEIARRIGRTRESVRQLSTGLRGPGGFPAPVHDLRGQSPLWCWAEVVEWVGRNLPDAPARPGAWESAAFVAALNGALRVHQLVPTVSVVQSLWRTMNRWRGKQPTPRFAWLEHLRRTAQ